MSTLGKVRRLEMGNRCKITPVTETIGYNYTTNLLKQKDTLAEKLVSYGQKPLTRF